MNDATSVDTYQEIRRPVVGRGRVEDPSRTLSSSQPLIVHRYLPVQWIRHAGKSWTGGTLLNACRDDGRRSTLGRGEWKGDSTRSDEDGMIEDPLSVHGRLDPVGQS